MAETTTSTSRANGTILRIVPLAVVALLVLAGCGNAAPPLEPIFIDRTESGLAPSTMSGILATQEALVARPDDNTLTFTLASAYLQALRENADPAYYDRIESLLRRVEIRDAGNPEVPFLRATVAAGRHDFHGAAKLAKQVTSSHPEVARYYGVLVDALVETGQYDAAVTALQKMADIRPDYSALTRIAYLREIYGDVPGAIESMERALEAGTAVPENVAWTHAELARLWLPSNPERARTLCERALEIYPGYAPALAGLARVEMASGIGNADAALVYAERAQESLALPEYAALLGDIHAAKGDAKKAAAQFTLVQLGYQQIAASGTDVELERVKFLLDHALETGSLVTQARAVYADRPTIFTADALAWALHGVGETGEAREYAAKALATGSKDPVIRFHAALIAKAAGEKAEARTLLEAVRAESPHFSFRLEPVLERELTGL